MKFMFTYTSGMVNAICEWNSCSHILLAWLTLSENEIYIYIYLWHDEHHLWMKFTFRYTTGIINIVWEWNLHLRARTCVRVCGMTNIICEWNSHSKILLAWWTPFVNEIYIQVYFWHDKHHLWMKFTFSYTSGMVNIVCEWNLHSYIHLAW